MPPTTPSPVRTTLSRRSLLAGAASTAVLAACGSGAGNSDTGTTSTPSTGAGPATGASGAPGGDAATRAMVAAGLEDAHRSLAPQLTWPEVIVGWPQYLQFVVSDQDASPPTVVTDPVQVWLVGEDQSVLAGPLEAAWLADDRIPSGGLHSVQVEVKDPGLVDVVVATRDNAMAGTGAVQAMTGETSRAPAPGEVLPAVGTPAAETPTVDDPGNLEELCTRDPDCDLHGVTLAAALDAGPTVLCIATPKFCATAICGPVLDDVVSVADSGEHPDVSFVHVEPYVDAGETVTDLMTELELPTEPWTFVLEADGTIFHRFPGPVLPSILEEVLDSMPTA